MMTNATVTHHSRRQALRSQRRSKVWQGIWRFSLLVGLSGGLSWGLSQPHWLIRDSSQIQMQGNQLLSSQKIEEMLKVSYPQTLWTFPSQTIREQLLAKPPITEIQVTRSLFPPQIVLDIQERQPIAEAISQGQKGFLDTQGVFIAASFYNRTDKRLKLPFKVIGYDEQYKSQWQTIYPSLKQSPVKIQTLDWRNPNNLIVQTDLGKVHLGAYSENFKEKIAVLSQMTRLYSQIPKDRLIYIDLSNPEQPTVQLKHEPQKTPPQKDIKKS